MDMGLRNSLFLYADEVQVGWKAYHNDVLQFGKKAGLLRTLESVVFGMFPYFITCCRLTEAYYVILLTVEKLTIIPVFLP